VKAALVTIKMEFRETYIEYARAFWGKTGTV